MRAPRRAGGRASAAGAARTPGPSRRCRRGRSSPRAASRAACRAPSRGWSSGRRCRTPRDRAGISSRRRRASAAATPGSYRRRRRAPPRTAGGARRRAAGGAELVEEEAAQRLRRARVPREERALHDLGQVDEREDRAVEVGEVGGEGGAFLPCELVGHLEGDLSTSPTVRRPYAGRLESAWDRYYYLAASRSRCAIPLTAERSTWHEAQVPARCRPDRRRVVVRRAGPDRLYQARPALAVGTERSDRRDQPGDRRGDEGRGRRDPGGQGRSDVRSEEHTSELQSRLHLVCRLLLEKKKKK